MKAVLYEKLNGKVYLSILHGYLAIRHYLLT